MKNILQKLDEIKARADAAKIEYSGLVFPESPGPSVNLMKHAITDIPALERALRAAVIGLENVIHNFDQINPSAIHAREQIAKELGVEL